MAPQFLAPLLKMVPTLLHLPFSQVWSSYDAQGDGLYITFKRPSHANDTELLDDDVLIRYEGKKIVGITVLHASRRLRKH